MPRVSNIVQTGNKPFIHQLQLLSDDLLSHTTVFYSKKNHLGKNIFFNKRIILFFIFKKSLFVRDNFFHSKINLFSRKKNFSFKNKLNITKKNFSKNFIKTNHPTECDIVRFFKIPLVKKISQSNFQPYGSVSYR